MDRLISENKVLEAIDNLKANFTCYDFVTLDEVASHVKAIPSVEPKTDWIPVSEKMPEYMVSVLTWDGGAICIEKRIPYILDDNGEPIESDWWVNDEYEDGSEYYPNLRDGAAIAWMPLPTSYEPQEGSKE